MSIAQKHEKVLLDGSGFVVARDVEAGLAQDFNPQSIELRDGANGDQGAVGVLRAKKNETAIDAVFKYTAQGMGHGHFDKLTLSVYNNGDEVLQDYGVARFVNIEQKDGGGYLKENKSFAKQTIAHNTLVVNETSHFKGKTKVGNKFHSDAYLFSTRIEGVQVASAKETNAYEGVNLQRTVVTMTDGFSAPVIVDIFKVQSDKSNQY